MISRRNVLASTAAVAAASAAGTGQAQAEPGPSPTTAGAGGRAAPVEITAPTVEYARRPLGLDEPRPRFSWPMASDEPGCGRAPTSCGWPPAPRR